MMTDTVWETGLASVDWLSENLDNPNLRVLDATWAVSKSNESFAEGYIPGAAFFDLGYLKSVTDPFAAYPDQKTVASMLNALGIQETNGVVIYDSEGFFSAPRIWWSLKTLGHEKVAVLQDGLPAWLKADKQIATSTAETTTQSTYITGKTSVKGVKIEDVVASIGTNTQIVDARSSGRFYGTAPEPRAGLRSGHIPGSVSLPLSTLKNAEGELKEEQELRDALSQADINLTKPIITTCGSGVTAAALALIFHSIGKEDVAVYSGSWTEYGASDYPVETQ